MEEEIQIDSSVSGSISAPNETDSYTVHLEAGETYLVSLRGTGDAPLEDPYLTIVAPGGDPTVIDDDGGYDINSLYTITAEVTGDYTIVAGGYPDAGVTGDYTIHVQQQTPDTVGDDFDTATDLTVGETTFSFLETDGDIDVYAVTVDAGMFYEFEVAGGADYMTDYQDVPPGELDTVMRIYDAEGNLVASNDDLNFPDNIGSGTGFLAEHGGTYYIQIDAYEGNTGGYTLDSRAIDLSQLNPLDAIDWGTTVDSTNVTVYFAQAGEEFDGTTSLGWSAYEISRAMAAFQTYANVTNLTFSITNDPDAATFKMVTTESDEFLGVFNPPGEPNAGVGMFAVNGSGWNDTGGLEMGGYGFITLIHEIGHGLGAAHPHDTGGTSQTIPGVNGPFGSYGVYNLNQGVYTTMSYNDGWQFHPDTNADGFPTDYPDDYGYQGVPMALDIALMQEKYGADPNRNAGNTTYVLNAENGPGTFYSAIWDTGGIDTIVYNGTAAARIDLTAATLDYTPTGAGVVSYVDGVFGGYTIANGVVIENATGGARGDILIGNSAANTLDGRGGGDTMVGRDGNDRYIVDAFNDVVIEMDDQGNDVVEASISYALTEYVERLFLTGTANINGTGNGLANELRGNSGNNTLNGGGGADVMRGGLGNDRYIVDNVNDKVYELEGEGNDRIEASVSYSLVGQYVEMLMLTGAAHLNATGNSQANTLVGNTGNNILDGREGADTLRGGAGNDHYIVDNVGDMVVELADEGIDHVKASVSFSLAGQAVERLTLTGTDNLNGTGNGLDNMIWGNIGNNSLDGGAGADLLYGGRGDDRYYIDNVNDRAVEAKGEGYDLVFSSVSYSIQGEYVEELWLTGTSAINGTGNSLANSVYGNSGINTLRGEGGNDTLDGGLGSDKLTGGAGQDNFFFTTDLGAKNVDTITDFNVADDTIHLDRSIFTTISGEGTLDAAAFHMGTAAHDLDDRIIYDQATGKIWYDPDGTGKQYAAVLFAQVTAGAALTNADFFIHA